MTSQRLPIPGVPLRTLPSLDEFPQRPPDQLGAARCSDRSSAGDSAGRVIASQMQRRRPELGFEPTEALVQLRMGKTDHGLSLCEPATNLLLEVQEARFEGLNSSVERCDTHIERPHSRVE